MRGWSRVATPVALVTVALAGMVAAGSPSRVVALRLWVVALGLIAARWLVDRVRAAPTARRHDRFEALTDDPTSATRARRPSVERAGWLLTLAAGTAGDLHYRARPVLREIAQARLADRGIDIDDPTWAAAAALQCGPLLWEVVRPDRPGPVDRNQPALRRADVPTLIDHLEAL